MDSKTNLKMQKQSQHFIDKSFSLLNKFNLDIICRVYVTMYQKTKKRKRSYILIQGTLNNKNVKFDSTVKFLKYIKENNIKVNNSNYYFDLEQHIQEQRKLILGKPQQVKNQYAMTPDSLFQYFKSNKILISNFDPAPVQPLEDSLSVYCKWIEPDNNKFVYINPPYNNINDFLKKLQIELNEGNLSKAILLIPSRTQNQWFKKIINLSYRMEYNDGVQFKNYKCLFPYGCFVAYIDKFHEFYLKNESTVVHIFQKFI